MKFSLRNMLLAIIFLAGSMSLLLSDAYIKDHMAVLQQQQNLIDASKSFHLPPSKAELQENINKYNFQEVALCWPNSR